MEFVLQNSSMARKELKGQKWIFTSSVKVVKQQLRTGKKSQTTARFFYYFAPLYLKIIGHSISIIFLDQRYMYKF